MANFIAIDLEPTGVYAATGDARGAVKVTHAAAWTADDADPPPALTLDTAKAFGEKLRDKLRAAGGPPGPVLVSVGRDRVILKELKHPPVPPSEEPALIRFQAIKEMSESPDDVVLDYVPLPDEGPGDGGERRAMAVMLRKDVFHAIQAMTVAAGLKLAGVTPRPYAVAAGLTQAFAAGTAPRPEHKGDTVAALTLGPGGGEFTVVRGGAMILTLAIPAPVLASETMLVAQLRRNLTVYAGQHPGHPIAAVYLAEVGEGWADRLAAALPVPVHAYDPLGGALPKMPEHFRGRFAGAVGLLAGRAHDALPINFAQPRQPTTARDPAKKKLLLAALAAGLLLAVGGAFAYTLLNASDAQTAELAARRDELKDKTEKGKTDVTRVAAVDAWSKREVVWLDELFDMADRMPADDSVRLVSLSATAQPVGKDGKQPTQALVDMKLVAANVSPINGLMSAIERDNIGGSKYYTTSAPLPAGAAQGTGTRLTQAFDLKGMKVNHREPSRYERNPAFTPPKKSWGLFAVTPTAPPEPEKTEPDPDPDPDAVEVAPPPTEKGP